jgi:phospholipase/carboxylesterase
VTIAFRERPAAPQRRLDGAAQGADAGVLPRPGAGSEPEGLLVLFHGRGVDENDLFPLLDELDPDRRLLGITPRGPLSLPPGGSHWYVVREVGYPDPSTFRSTYAAVSEWLDALAAESGIEPERTVLGGFSQGAAMTYALGLGEGRPRAAGLIALSGFVPTVEGFELDLSPPLPPVAIGHGEYDPVIPVEWGRRAKALLENAGAEVLYHESPLPHAVDPGFLAELRPWLAEAL